MNMKTMKANKGVKKLIREINRPIKIESKRYGNLDLRPLAAKDMEFLSNIIQQDLSPRDFTIKVIRQTLKNPRLGEKKVKEFPDDYLIMIATKIAKDRRMNLKELPTGRITLELFKLKIVEDFIETNRKAASLLKPYLPWLKNFQENWIKDIDQGEKILKKCGYRHTGQILRKEGFRIFANIGPNVRDARVTNAWLNLTRQNWFRDELKERFQNSAMLRSRWKILEKAWEAHQRRDYILSIPVFLTQIEGILGDALVLNHCARSKNGKLFKLDSDGTILIENGKQKEIIGISSIIEHPYFSRISRLDEAIKFLRKDEIIVERNAILHGRKVSYGRAKLSTQSLLLIYALIRDAAEFEPPIVIPSSSLIPIEKPTS